MAFSAVKNGLNFESGSKSNIKARHGKRKSKHENSFDFFVIVIENDSHFKHD